MISSSSPVLMRDDLTLVDRRRRREEEEKKKKKRERERERRRRRRRLRRSERAQQGETTRREINEARGEAPYVEMSMKATKRVMADTTNIKEAEEVSVVVGGGGNNKNKRRRVNANYWKAGFIRRIHIENFMKHKNFTIELGQNVTFISGKNGSGKSATLQALQCCLGVTAKQMGRGSKLGSFVRRGCASALVVVTVSNEGPEAFKPEVYGSSISVERRIDTKGGGRFVIRNENGKEVGKQKWELNMLLDHLNLMVANPCVVTTQDIARTFLSGDTDDSSRYKLFMKATMLEQVKENLAGTALTINKMKELLTLKEKEVNKKLGEFKVAKKQLDHARQIKQHAELEKHCESVLAWREVILIEDEIEQLRKKLNVKGPEYLEKLKLRLEGAKEKLSDLETKKNKRQEAVEKFTMEAEALKSTILNSKSDVKKLIQEEVKQQNHLDSLKQDVGTLQQEKESLEESLKDTETLDVSSTQAIHKKYDHQIEDMKREVERIAEEENKIKHSLDSEKGDRDRLFSKSQNLKRRKAEYQNNAQRLERALSQMSSPRGRGRQRRKNADVFGQGYNKLLDEIERNQSRFHRPPIGPLGIHLELPDDRWAVAIEGALGNLFGNFILHDEHDQQEFFNCCRRAQVRFPSCQVSSFDRRRIHISPQNMPSSEFITVASVIKDRHPTCSHVIWNALVDSARIESTLLLDDFEFGKQAIFNGRAHPAKRGYTNKGQLLEVRGRTQIVRSVYDPNYQRPRLDYSGRDLSKDKQRFEQQLSETRRALSDVLDEMKDCDASIRENSDCCSQLESDIDKLSDKRVELEEKVKQAYEQLQEALHEALGTTGKDGEEGIEAQIADIQVKIVDHEKRLGSVEEHLTQVQSEIGAHKNLIERKRAEMEKLRTENEEIVSNAQHLDNDLQIAEEEVEGLEARETNTIEKLAKLQADLDTHMPVYESKLKIVEEEICPRNELASCVKALEDLCKCELKVEVEEDMEVVETTLRKIRANIKNLEKECGSLEELEFKFLKVEKEYEQQQKLYLRISEPYRLIHESLVGRWAKFESMRKMLQKTTNFTFGTYMGKRGHAGQLKFDHKEEKLKIVVRMNSGGVGKAGSKVNDMKSLSGGERSLSTLSFVLALGTQCESPFRAADEFDVFMDAVNRKVSLRTLLQFAVDYPSTQMILLTPQDLGSVEEIKEDIKAHENYHDKFIKLIRMPQQN